MEVDRKAVIAIRLFLDLSKDEFVPNLTAALGEEGARLGSGIKSYKANKAGYVAALIDLGLVSKMTDAVNRPLHWYDVVTERLKGGRGSATKGQARGREMENFVEGIVRSVFDLEQVAVRCRFTGASGLSTEKSDFAIPSALAPTILIEVKHTGLREANKPMFWVTLQESSNKSATTPFSFS